MDVLLKDPGNGSDGVPRETRVQVHDCTMITVTADLTWNGPEAREVEGRWPDTRRSDGGRRSRVVDV